MPEHSPRIHVKPARPGAVVRDPVSRQRLPAEGKRVPRSSFWLRRLRDGDVVEVEKRDTKPAKSAKPETKKAKE